MERLTRFRGHFFNYDTSDLRALDPPYISSVDSGNLAGHLIALAGACAAWRGKPIATPQLMAGAEDSLKTPVSKLSKMMKRTVGALRQQAIKLGIGLGHRR